MLHATENSFGARLYSESDLKSGAELFPVGNLPTSASRMSIEKCCAVHDTTPRRDRTNNLGLNFYKHAILAGLKKLIMRYKKLGVRL